MLARRKPIFIIQLKITNMRNLVILIFAFVCFTACQSNTKKADNKTKPETTQVLQYDKIELNVTGMTCTGCENTVENGLKNIDGVVDVKASHKDNKVILKVEKDKVNREEVAQKIEAVGYKVEE